ncbi:hypothetical protein MNVM_00200 [Mycobacterium novum]|uniref:Uncharacterized protein n=1 Tax=Mycobacterium novum TaxID=2492438 RepID=A0A7I7JHY5_9MYCO|nr:hypothetical protein MNVM_00200 [Mycobacterium novum]
MKGFRGRQQSKWRTWAVARGAGRPTRSAATQRRELATSGAHPPAISGARPEAADRIGIGIGAANRGATTTAAHGRRIPPLRNRLRATTIHRFPPGSNPGNWLRRCVGN